VDTAAGGVTVGKDAGVDTAGVMVYIVGPFMAGVSGYLGISLTHARIPCDLSKLLE
jgi:hypothetical protein